MAESSITHNFVISDPEAVERFVNALEQSALDPRPKSDVPYLELKDPVEIAARMKRWSHQSRHQRGEGDAHP